MAMTIGDLAAIGGVISAQVTVGGLTFYMGRMSNRLQALESWRENLRKDFHEIDEDLLMLKTEFGRLDTKVDERTDRRVAIRLDPSKV